MSKDYKQDGITIKKTSYFQLDKRQECHVLDDVKANFGRYYQDPQGGRFRLSYRLYSSEVGASDHASLLNAVCCTLRWA